MPKMTTDELRELIAQRMEKNRAATFRSLRWALILSVPVWIIVIWCLC